MWSYSLGCVGPGRNPEDLFSHNEAHLTSEYLLHANTNKGAVAPAHHRGLRSALVVLFVVLIMYLNIQLMLNISFQKR